MPTTLQFRRANTSATGSITGANGEITVDTDKETVVVHDGVTAGGFALAREGAYTQANSARDQANTARTQANTAYDQANTARNQGNTAYGQANAAYGQANAAYGQANAAYGQANAAYTAANNAQVTVYANSASAVTTQRVNFVNTATITVAVSSSGSNANISFTAVGGAAYDQANSARDQANTARTQANTAYGQANAAYTAANNAKVTVFANSGAANATTQNLNFVNTSTILVTVANTSGNANVTFAIIGTPYDQANTARDQANTARTQANTAYGQANAAYGQANSAYGAANNRVLKAGDTMTGILVTAGVRNTKNTVDQTNANTDTNAANNINLDESNFFTRTLTANVAFTFRNAAASGNAHTFTLVVIQDATGSRVPTFSNTVYWTGGSIPPYTSAANARDMWNFVTYDGGTTYWGTLSMKDMR